MAARTLIASLVAVLVAATPAVAASKPRPDLRPTAPHILSARTVTAGATVEITYAVANRGRRRARATRMRFLLSRDARSSRDDVVVGERRIPALRRGRTTRRTARLRVPTADFGAWRLVACADARRRVRERREGNNCRAAVLPLRFPAPPPPPPPPIEQPPPDPEPSATPRVEDTTLPLPILTPPPNPGPRPTTPASLTDCGPVIPEDGAAASEFTAMFAATETGWTGGDATFSIELPNGNTAWWFGDSFLGGITLLGGRDQPYPDIRNAVVVQDDCLTTRFRGTSEQPNHFELSADDESWYWLNQPVRHGDDIHVFATRMVEGQGGVPYAVDGVAHMTYDLDLNRVAVDREVPALQDQWWGAAFADDPASEYTYVFGIRDVSAFDKHVYLARVPFHDLGGTWEYRTASGWSTTLTDAAPVLTDDGHVSTQLSILQSGDELALISQDPGGSAVNVWRASAATPWTWGARATVTTLPPVAGGRTYNALVHPQFTAGDQLLISYNVIADSETLTMAQADLYRPRFVRAALP